MNYYIQGNKEKADQIKAAFGKYVSTQEMAEYDFSQEEYLFYTGQEERGTFVYAAWSDSVIAEIIKTHPDYQELELPVEPKFKVGDSLQSGSDFTKILSINLEEGRYYCDNRIISFENQDLWHLVPKPHYDIANFKPFDKVLVRCSNDEEWEIEFYCKYDTLVHTSPHRDYPFMGIGDSYSQCIPYEGNEHLLGTTDMCDEMYINW